MRLPRSRYQHLTYPMQRRRSARAHHGVCHRPHFQDRPHGIRRLAGDGLSAGAHDRPGEHYTFTLRLHEQTGAGITFTRVTQTVSAAHVQPMTTAQDGQWRLPPKGELRLPFQLVWSCAPVLEPCSAVAGPPHWHILLTGTDDHGDPVQLGLEVDPLEGEVAGERVERPSAHDPLNTSLRYDTGFCWERGGMSCRAALVSLLGVLI
jgi:hypothetical protein